MAKVVKRTKGKSQYATQLDADLLAEWRRYVESRGETLTLATERAFRREMAYPPPPPAPPPPLEPLPDGEAAPKAKRRGRPKKTPG